jgi:hypothetical protein
MQQLTQHSCHAAAHGAADIMHTSSPTITAASAGTCTAVGSSKRPEACTVREHTGKSAMLSVCTMQVYYACT